VHRIPTRGVPGPKARLQTLQIFQDEVTVRIRAGRREVGSPLRLLSGQDSIQR
jgi:hypothetical protein